MRFLSEYALYFVAMLVATIVFVKPITRSHWPLVAKIGLYVISGALFVCILLFEYFTKTSLTDIVRETVGSTVCHLYPLKACPKEVHERVERLREQAKVRQPEPMRLPAVPERAPPVPEPVRPTPIERVAPAFPFPTEGPIAKCNTLRDEADCKVRETCTWVAEVIDAKTGKQKIKAYCRAKPRPPVKRTEELVKK